MSIPSFLLRKLYVPGSLKNSERGFELALRNNLAPGSLIGLGPLTIDETTYPPEAIIIRNAEREHRGDQISHQNPLVFDLNSEVEIEVQGEPLTAGAHHIVLSVLTREVGRLEFDLTDNLSA